MAAIGDLVLERIGDKNDILMFDAESQEAALPLVSVVEEAVGQ